MSERETMKIEGEELGYSSLTVGRVFVCVENRERQTHFFFVSGYGLCFSLCFVGDGKG